MKTKKGKFLLIILSVEILLFLLLGVRMAVGMNLFILFSLLGSLIKTYPLLLLRMKMRNVSLGKEIIRKNSSHPKQQDVIDVKDVKIDNINDTIEEELVYDELFR